MTSSSSPACGPVFGFGIGVRDRLERLPPRLLAAERSLLCDRDWLSGLVASDSCWAESWMSGRFFRIPPSIASSLSSVARASDPAGTISAPAFAVTATGSWWNFSACGECCCCCSCGVTDETSSSIVASG
ncbi:hypothetical protein ABW21_db0200318 [Orbilia brochopaga]|nr:hypothetical protein ABW21_db0200318 [Drechslerella brochopaga]